MQQRRLRLGDILDDYCPRERRVTNHAVVAMIDDQVKQTRCTTCDADHEYKQAKVPPPRRKKEGGALFADTPEVAARPRAVPATAPQNEEELMEDPISVGETPTFDETPPVEAEAADATEPSGPVEDEGPVHRPLIRATLPRPEGQVPERKNPEFTVRQPGTRGREFDGNKSGARHSRGRRPPRGPGGSQQGQQMRFGPPRSGNAFRQGSGQSQRQGGGNREGPSGGNQRGGGRPSGGGPGRGPRPNSGGGGRKRGR